MSVEKISLIANIATILGFLSVLVTIIILIIQNRLYLKALRVQTYQAVYDKMINIEQFLMERPNLKPYIYENKSIDNLRESEKNSVLSCCEMFTDFFEEVIGCKESMTIDKWNGWKNYMGTIYANSIAIQYFISINKKWYTPQLINMLDKYSNNNISKISKINDNEIIYGWELILNMKECKTEILYNAEELVSFVMELCELIKMKRFGNPIIQKFGFSEEHTAGYTVVQLIETSSIVIHISELTQSIYMNIFSCKKFNKETVLKFCVDTFKPKISNNLYLTRN